jgi:hypothetical protein
MIILILTWCNWIYENFIIKENNIIKKPETYREIDDTGKLNYQLSIKYNEFFLNRENSFINDTQ